MASLRVISFAEPSAREMSRKSITSAVEIRRRIGISLRTVSFLTRIG